MECPNCRTAAYRSRLDEYQSFYFHTHHLHRLRTTNESPSEDEANFVNGTVLREIQDDTDNVDARLVELQSAANALIRERDQLVRYANSFKSLLSPIRRLPPELLMEIFQHACVHDAWDNSFHRRETHWIIPHVCREWRRVALSCPLLWSSIHAFLRPTFPAIPALDAMLHRSGIHSLNVRLVNYHYSHDLHVQDFLARIRTQSWRWRALEIDVPRCAFEDTLEILRGSYPLLERLDIDVENDFYTPFPDFQRTGFSQYPILRTVVLQDPLITEIDLPWAQLTTLIITDNFRGDVLSYTKAFRQCPSLQTLQVNFAEQPSLEDASPVVPLRALKSLDTAFDVVINHLVVPQLEEVRLGVDYLGNYDEGQLNRTIPSFHKLVLRSKCALIITSIHLRKIPLTADLLAVLSLTTNLATLEIRAKMSHFDGTSDALCMKTVMTLLSMLQVADLPFLPKLRHLSVNLSKHLERRYFPYLEKQDELVKALQSRWNVASGTSVERLRTFRFGIFALHLDDKDSSPSDSPLELDQDTEEALQVLMNEGMKISIRVYSKFARHDADHVRVNFGNM